jgi:tRNA dimethylallyltransferase
MITILGPTATGKTRLATRLATLCNGEIVSADSRQVYQGMNIGTGKDLKDYRIDGKAIPFHLIDIAIPGTEYNVFQYQQAAVEAIKNIQNQGKTVILCGGSGMYIEALLKGYKLFPVPENQSLRSSLESKTDDELITLLLNYKSLHNTTDIDTRERMLKALEIEVYYSQHPKLSQFAQAIPSTIFGLYGNREVIRSKITHRLRQRLSEGMIEEVQQLLDQGVNPEQLLRYGLEYKYITLYLQRSITYEEMFRLLNIAIHQFSKRQMTWFRKMERSGFAIHWIDIERSEEEKLAEMMAGIVVSNPK